MDAKPANPHSTRGENERKVFQRDRTPHIFRPIDFRSVRVRNRITMSPMCQYSAENGVPGDWHFQHLCSRAVGGAGIVFTESVAIEPRGLITSHCLGLWNDEQRDAYARIARAIKAAGAIPAIQLNHSGRKGAVGRPWEGGKPLKNEEGAWPLIAPSALAFGDHTGTGSARRRNHRGYARAVFDRGPARARSRLPDHRSARRARLPRARFMSPLANQRTDNYGGSFENRTRFLREAIAAVRTQWPDDLPLFVRISATDWAEGGWDLASSVQLAQALKATGMVDLIDCSSGGLVQRRNHHSSGLPGAFCRGRAQRCRHRDQRGGHDPRRRHGGADRCEWPGRHGEPGPRDVDRSRTGLCMRRMRCARRSSGRCSTSAATFTEFEEAFDVDMKLPEKPHWLPAPAA